MGYYPPRIGCEVELPLLPQNPAIYRKQLEPLWSELVNAMGAGWIVDRDPRTGGITGMSNHDDPNHPSICYDASILLLEFALPPCPDLATLKAIWHDWSGRIFPILARYDIRVLGTGMHPDLDIHVPEAYATWSTPKAVYSVLKRRGWQHRYNLRCASIQPSIDLPLLGTIDYINTLEKALPFLQPVCANSSIECWKSHPDIAEARDYLGWSAMMRESPDLDTIGMPRHPYTSMADYFSYLWKIPMYYVSEKVAGGYKKSEPIDLFERPSLATLMTKPTWRGQTFDGHEVQVVVDRLDPQNTLQIDWYSFRPVRLRYRLRSPLTWSDVRATNDPSTLCTHFYAEVRSLGNQLPGEAMLTTVLALGLVRNQVEVWKYLQRFSWDQVVDFYYNHAPRFDAWDATIAGIQYPTVARELLAIIEDALHSSERAELTKLHERLKHRTSPAKLTIEALAKSRETYLDLITYPSL